MSNMSPSVVQRRLAAVLSADIAGYSALMASNDEATVSDLKGHQSVILPLVSEFSGRIIDTAGDGILAEFGSAVNATNCAIAMQKTMAERNSRTDPARCMHFRVGVNLGDIVFDDHRIYGDGINIAARLQEIASPGGICISGKVHEEITGKVKAGADFEDLGGQNLKNIPRPVHAYRLGSPYAGPVAQAPAARLGITDRPSIAVLPFTNMSGDPEQEYLADGIVEDIITALSRFRWLLVIARNSTFTYSAVDIRQVARELGVRYVLEGSVRKSGNRLRITGQLIDAESAGHLWADRYDGELRDVFDLQDRVTSSVASAIEPRVLAAELVRATQKSTSKLDAYDCCLRARPHVLKLTRPDLDDATRLLRSATQLDPKYGQAWGMLALCTANRYFLGHLPFQAVASDALQFARRAVECDRDHPEVLAVAAYMFAWGGQADESMALADRAIELNPYSSYACRYAGWTAVFNGAFEKAISLFRTTLVLDPSPYDASVLVGTAAANFYLKRYDEAITWASRANSKNPEVTSSFRYLAASLAHAGRAAEAKIVVRRLLEYQPNSSLTRSSAGSALRHGWMLEHYLEGLRMAGLPE
jgi:adenylate cyclase